MCSSTHSWLSLDGHKLDSFIPQALHPCGKCQWYPLDWRISGSQSQSECCVKGKFSSPYQDLNSNYSAVQPTQSYSILLLAFMKRQKTLYLLLLSLLFLFFIAKKLLNSNEPFLMPYLNESTIEKQNMSATNLDRIGYKTESCILLLPCILSQLILQPTNALNTIHNKY